MTEELKATTEIKTCDCKEKAIKKLQEFAFIAGAVFVGTTLSILLCANVLKPKCPMAPFGPMGPRPAIHRQLPPPVMNGAYHKDFTRANRGDCPCKRFKKHHNLGLKNPNFKHNWDKKGPQETPKTQEK